MKPCYYPSSAFLIDCLLVQWEVKFHVDGGYYTVRSVHGGDEFLGWEGVPHSGVPVISGPVKNWTIRSGGRGDTYRYESFEIDDTSQLTDNDLHLASKSGSLIRPFPLVLTGSVPALIGGITKW